MTARARTGAVRDGDEAVSPVIAAILLVGITVVLAGAVYVFMSAIGSSGNIPMPFPQTTLKDAPDSFVTSADGDSLVVLEHRGGDAIDWIAFTVSVLRNGNAATGASAVDFSLNADCSTGNVATPTAHFDVGNRLYVCATSNGWSSGDQVKLRVIETDQATMVYEASDVVR